MFLPVLLTVVSSCWPPPTNHYQSTVIHQSTVARCQPAWPPARLLAGPPCPPARLPTFRLPACLQVAMALSLIMSFPVTIWPMRQDFIGGWQAAHTAQLGTGRADQQARKGRPHSATHACCG
jgi:hypothetical protein